jgi:hypothetical protein
MLTLQATLPRSHRAKTIDPVGSYNTPNLKQQKSTRAPKTVSGRSESTRHDVGGPSSGGSAKARSDQDDFDWGKFLGLDFDMAGPLSDLGEFE